MSQLAEVAGTLHLQHPLWLLVAVPVLAAWAWARRRPPTAIPFAPAALLTPELPRSRRQRLVRLPAGLQVAALLLTAFALAGPAAVVQAPREAEGIDLLLCLDRSSSMAAADLDPERSRLELARAQAARFAAGRPQDRIGLLVFARYPDLVCPPTLDRKALADILEQVEMVPPDDAEDATGIGGALARAAQLLRRSEAPSRVVVLLTDGEENVATPLTPDEITPAEAAALCREWGVRVHVLAVGAEAASGASLLRRVAASTGGTFQLATDVAALDALWGVVDDLETVRFHEPRERRADLFLPVLVLALVLLGAGRLLGTTILEVLP